MTAPIIYEHPIRRPGFITDVVWEGEDDDLQLKLSFPDAGGTQRNLHLRANEISPGERQQICLPNSNKDIHYLDEDTLLAHVRMLTMVAGFPLGSQEWSDAWDADLLGKRDLQTAIGKVLRTGDVVTIDEQFVQFTVKRKNQGATREMTISHSDIRYTFTPQTQLLVVAGAIEAEFPNYQHDYPDSVLSSQERQDIVDYVMGLEPWI